MLTFPTKLTSYLGLLSRRHLWCSACPGEVMRSEASRDRRPTTLWKHDPNLILAGEFLVPEETGWDGRR